MVYDVLIYAKLCKNKLFQMTKHFIISSRAPFKIFSSLKKYIVCMLGYARDMDDDRDDDDDDK